MTEDSAVLFLPGDPQASGDPPAAISPLAATAPVAARVLLGSAAFVLGACVAQPWHHRETTVARTPARGEATTMPPAGTVAPPPPETPAASAPNGRLLIPVAGVTRERLRDNFADRRGLRVHKALDIMAPRGTHVVAVADGEVAKVYRHILGGLSVYQYDAERRYSYYYAHLDGYAPGLREGMVLRRGELVGFVGTTGNATPSAPHLHFAMLELGPDRKWWKGTPVNPYPLFE